MGEDRYWLLLVEDDPEDRELILHDLKPVVGKDHVVCAGRLQEAVELAASRSFDLIILDLGLPDSQGFETFLRLHESVPRVPFVVMTGRDDDETAVQALQAGAQDYLVKGQAGPELLRRSIHYSVERHRLLLRLDQERAFREQEIERLALERLAAPSPIRVTSCIYGRRPLKETAPVLFGDMVERYIVLLDKAIERQIFKNQESSDDEIRRMAEEMGTLFAGPKDVLELHMQGLKRRCQAQPPSKLKALTDEGRFLMIELMGHLVSFYRDYYSGCARQGAGKGQETVDREGAS
jgi:CheY-like chemotaxis protein